MGVPSKYNSSTVYRPNLKFTHFHSILVGTFYYSRRGELLSWKQLSCWLSPAEKANFTTTLPLTTTYKYRAHTQTGKWTGQFLVDGFGDPYSGWDYGCRKRKNSPIKPSPTSHRALIINGSALSPKSFIYPWTGSSSISPTTRFLLQLISWAERFNKLSRCEKSGAFERLISLVAGSHVLWNATIPSYPGNFVT